MPLREVAHINARHVFSNLLGGRYLLNLIRLDAVENILDHPTFEKKFTSIAKGLPDLERIVSRIHAKNCKVKDFLKVLSVCYSFISVSSTMSHKRVRHSKD